MKSLPSLVIVKIPAMNSLWLIPITVIIFISSLWFHYRWPEFMIKRIAIKSIKQLLDERYNFYALINRKYIEPDGIPHIVLYDIYERCQRNGIEKYMAFDKEGIRNLNQIILDNKRKL